MPALISLCMIAKDEEDEIALALQSAAKLADELVVYDTGSSDATVTIARSLGAQVVEGYWDDDFARARNDALSYCTGEWALWLDADETVHGDFATFREALAKAPKDLVGVSLPIELLEGNGLAGRGVFQAMRLFRRARCHWEGRLHEQVLLEDGTPPPAAPAAGLRLLHKGYTVGYVEDGAKSERNLRIAERALEDPDENRGLALFNFARTLMMGNEPARALAPLEEALALPEGELIPRVRRYGLGTLVTLHLATGDTDAALTAVERLRAISERPVTADMLEARVCLARGDHGRCLELCERIPFLELDDDGNEVGRHQVSSLRARALLALERPSEAADVLLESLRSHGVLDEPLDVLVGLLLAAGRDLAEITDALQPDVLAVFCGAAGGLQEAQADVLLTAVRERFPDRLEPLAVGAGVAARLPVARALWWSAELRRSGLTDQCPLAAIARNDELEPLVRLRAAAAAFGSFSDQRVVRSAQLVVARLDSATRAAALADVAGISPDLAGLIAPSAPTCAALLSLDGRLEDGFECYTTRSRPGEGVSTTRADALPLADGAAHLLVVAGVIDALGPSQVGFALDEWLRVLAPGGELVVEATDLEAALRRLLATIEPAAPAAPGRGSPVERKAARADALRLLYGPQRYGDGGAEESYRCSYTAASLAELLSRHGFAVETVDVLAGTGTLCARARAPQLAVRVAPSADCEVSVVVLSEHGAEALRGCLTAVASSDAGTTYEVICVDAGGDPAVGAFVATLAGAATVISSPVTLSEPAALNLAARFATGRTLVLLRDSVQVRPGWAAELCASLAEAGVVLASATLVDEQGGVRGGPLALHGDAVVPTLDLRPVSVAVPRAVGAGCVAIGVQTFKELRGLAGDLDLEDAVVDLSLRASDVGTLAGLPSLRLVGQAVGGAAPSEHLSASRRELAHRWSARVELAARPGTSPTVASLLPATTLLDRIENAGELRVGSARPGGCNIVGELASQSPDAARAHGWVRAQRAADLGCSTVTFGSGPLVADSGDALPFDTTLLCLKGEDLVEFVARAGLDSLRGRYTILDLHWPFGAPSEDLPAQAAMVSEVWVPSTFTQRALRGLTGRPIRHQAPPVTVPVATLSRGDLAIGGGFVVASIADLGRGRPGEVALANPAGAVQAFCAAFPPSSGPVLYLALTGSATGAAAEACREAAGGRSDVVVVEQIPEGGLDSVLALADCYLSLHRSSAFAMAVARSLAAGVPVVVPRVGGPLEYLDEAVAELVEATPATTTSAHTPYGAGLPWTEPDLDDAAAALYNVVEDVTQARSRARLGAARLARTNHVELAGRMLKRRIAVVAPQHEQPPQAHRARRRARR